MARRRQLTKKRLPLVVFLAGLALVAVVSGYVLERYVLGSFIATKGKPSGTPEPKAAPVKTEIAVPSSTLWRVQLGAFNSKQQADQLVESTKQKGFPAFVSGASPYRVLAGVTRTKDAAQKLSATLTKAGYKPYVAEFKSVEGTYTMTFSDAGYVPLFKNGVLTLADAVPLGAEAWDHYYNGKKNEFLSAANGLATTLTNVARRLATTTPAKGSENIHAALSALLDKASANAADIKTFAEKGGKDLYLKAAITHMEILDSLERFLAQLPK